MFGIDFNELLLIAVVALVVLGPDKLPGAARTAGAIARRARNAWASVRDEVERGLDTDGLAQQWRASSEAIRATTASAAEHWAATRTEVESGLAAAQATSADGSSAEQAIDGGPRHEDDGTGMGLAIVLARASGELRTLAARLDDAAGAERDDLRAVAADLRESAERLAHRLSDEAPAHPGVAAEASPVQAVARSLDGIAKRLRELGDAPPEVVASTSDGAVHAGREAARNGEGAQDA